jgi:glycine cleavage system H protein
MLRLYHSINRSTTHFFRRNITYYNKSHEWLDNSTTNNNRILRYGITKYAADTLGDVQYVNFSDVTTGKPYDKGEEVCVIESVKAVESIEMPFMGIIVNINENLNDQPELINDDPEENGWLMELQAGSGWTFDNNIWMSADDYQTFLNDLD